MRKRAAQRLPRRQPRLGGVAVLVGERQIVERAHEAGLQRPLRSAVEPQELAAVEVIDGAQALGLGQQTIARHADQEGNHEVDHVPLAPEVGIEIDDAGQLLA